MAQASVMAGLEPATCAMLGTGWHTALVPGIALDAAVIGFTPAFLHAACPTPLASCCATGGWLDRLEIRLGL